MTINQKTQQKQHPRNLHQGRYDFKKLISVLPELQSVTKLNPKGESTIDFTDSQSILLLNKALLKAYYAIEFWDIPAGYLCPPIPSRADYIHNLADLMALNMSDQKPPTGKQVKVIDIGTGANGIYPIIGAQSYGWHFTATDIDPVSIKTVKALIQCNTNLQGHIKPVLQPNAKRVFEGIIGADEYYDACLCNPPFHASANEASFANLNKQKKLAKNKQIRGTKNKALSTSGQKYKQNLNFGGQQAELWCEGGEIAFLKQMIKESHVYANNVGWFTSLVSKKDNLAPLCKLIKKFKATEVKVINMQQGQKKTRVLAWRF